MSMVAPIVAGGVAGAGLTLVVAQLLPSPPPELRSAVARLNSPLKEATPLFTEQQEINNGPNSSIIPESLIRWLDGSGLVRATSEDLALLGKTSEHHTAEKIGIGIVGLLFAPIGLL